MSEAESDIGHEDSAHSSDKDAKVKLSTKHSLKKSSVKSNLAQSIPVLSLKNRQIPNVDLTTSTSPIRYESINKPMELKNRTLDTPLERNKLFNKKN